MQEQGTVASMLEDKMRRKDTNNDTLLSWLDPKDREQHQWAVNYLQNRIDNAKSYFRAPKHGDYRFDELLSIGEAIEADFGQNAEFEEEYGKLLASMKKAWAMQNKRRAKKAAGARSIELDPETAEMLAALATSKGVDEGAYLQQLMKNPYAKLRAGNGPKPLAGERGDLQKTAEQLGVKTMIQPNSQHESQAFIPPASEEPANTEKSQLATDTTRSSVLEPNGSSSDQEQQSITYTTASGLIIQIKKRRKKTYTAPPELSERLRELARQRGDFDED